VAGSDRSTRRDFQELARVHLRGARALLRARLWQTAYYLTGYAVECGLKACIAKQTRRHDFPVRNTSDMYTHELPKLLQSAGLLPALRAEEASNSRMAVSWATVKDWRPASRYDLTVPESAARDLYRAVAGRNGVMRWIRQRW
jgi:hypothetical protein